MKVKCCVLFRNVWVGASALPHPHPSPDLVRETRGVHAPVSTMGTGDYGLPQPGAHASPPQVLVSDSDWGASFFCLFIFSCHTAM